MHLKVQGHANENLHVFQKKYDKLWQVFTQALLNYFWAQLSNFICNFAKKNKLV